MSINNNTTTLDDTVNNMKYSKGSKRSTHDRSKYRIGLISALVLLSFVASVVTLQHHAGGGAMIHRSALMEHKAIMPQEEASQRSTRIPLSKLTTRQVSPMECPNNLVLIQDRITVHVNSQQHHAHQIPHVIHQTSKSRCVVPSLAAAVQKWKTHLPDYPYYFHDDTAVTTLLSLPKFQTTFPLLKEIAQFCTRGAMRADLWRYVLLWEYGGIYSDVDTFPNATFALPQNVSAYFVLEGDGLLSQYFMAVAPKHPMLYFTIQHVVANLLKSKDPHKDFAPTLTGPRALHQGFQTYCGKVYNIPDSEGRWLGLNHPLTHGGYYTVGNWTVLVEGNLTNTDDIIVRDAIPREEKKRQYRDMNMKYFMEDARTAPQGESCLSLVYQSLEREHEKV